MYMSTLVCHSFCPPRRSSSLIIKLKLYNHIVYDILVLQNGICYHGNQRAAVLCHVIIQKRLFWHITQLI